MVLSLLFNFKVQSKLGLKIIDKKKKNVTKGGGTDSTVSFRDLDRR
jgi:hypothetical protein